MTCRAKVMLYTVIELHRSALWSELNLNLQASLYGISIQLDGEIPKIKKKNFDTLI